MCTGTSILRVMCEILRYNLLICFLAGILLTGECTEDDNKCVYIDNICLNSWDVANFEAIRTLHKQLDDDHNGAIDLSESKGFLREELNYTKEAEKRQNFFHPNNDYHISVKELWNMWLDSEVHNWTVENTVSWLCLNVDLSQYAKVFQENAVNGSFLPRLATNNDHILTKLGIKNPAHRSKISIKTMDVVLFGPSKDTGSYLKDITIGLLIIFLIIGAFGFYHVQKDFGRQRGRMMQEMEALNAEEKKFREELQVRRASFTEGTKEDSSVNEATPEANQNDSRPPSMKWHLADDSDSTTTTEISGPLQMWLQLSYEREKCAFDCKCQLVEAQLMEAKEMCEKLRPSKKQFFASLGLVHGKTEPKYDAIMEAVRDAIAETKLLHKEMEYRWNAIEKYTGCDIALNAGLTQLEIMLEPEIQRPNKTSSSTVGLGFKNSNLGQSSRKRDPRSSPETASIRSTSSLPTQNSIRSINSLQQSHTIASALGNSNAEGIDTNKESKSALNGQEANHAPLGISSTPSGSNSQLVSEPIKDAEVSGSTEVVDYNPPGNSTLPQVRSRVKPFFKSYSQDAEDQWPRMVGGKNDNKFKSEPALETDVSVVSETAKETVVNGTELVRWKRRSKFFRSKIFDKLKAKSDKTKIKEKS